MYVSEYMGLTLLPITITSFDYICLLLKKDVFTGNMHMFCIV